jgi:hypothetical protein
MSIITYRTENKFYSLRKKKKKNNDAPLPLGQHVNTLASIQDFHNLSTDYIFYFNFFSYPLELFYF